MKRTPKVDPSAEDRFLKGQTGQFPWYAANERVVIPFNLRLPEPLHLKLKFIAENTPKSMHAFTLEALEKAVENEVDRLVRK
jgi:hypothetical protein